VPSADPLRADAYEAFWQCIDADELSAPDLPVGADRTAYEQFWDLVDAE
jgi:hypothetical protein